MAEQSVQEPIESRVFHINALVEGVVTILDGVEIEGKGNSSTVYACAELLRRVCGDLDNIEADIRRERNGERATP